VLVPQTGKAVDGVWPGLVQGVCACTSEHRKASNGKRTHLIATALFSLISKHKYQISPFAGAKHFNC
jgi:hypothetical protein